MSACKCPCTPCRPDVFGKSHHERCSFDCVGVQMPSRLVPPYAVLPCSSRERRAAMTDEEFWEDVYPSSAVEPDPEDDQPDPPQIGLMVRPCDVCGTTGPCAYDPSGLPLIHADEEIA